VLTDAPGEWFSRWALDKNHKEGGGARWTAANSDAFILVVDCESLAGPNRGQARESLLRIAERLRSEIADAPVLVVWAKSDVLVKDSIKKSLEDDLTKLFPDHQSLFISAKREGDSNQITENAFKELWQWIFASRPFSGKDRLSLAPRSDDLFLMYRG
jgi:GTPase Era involved in 16S rRNA processing